MTPTASEVHARLIDLWPLTRDRIDWAQRRGLRSLYLLTTTAGDYFPRFGFTHADRETAPIAVRQSREFAESCPSTALFMTLPLHGEQRP